MVTPENIFERKKTVCFWENVEVLQGELKILEKNGPVNIKDYVTMK